MIYNCYITYFMLIHTTMQYERKHYIISYLTQQCIWTLSCVIVLNKLFHPQQDPIAEFHLKVKNGNTMKSKKDLNFWNYN